MALGIIETNEVLVAVNELGLLIAKHVKNGLDMSDVPSIIAELFSNDSFKDALGRAIKNVSQVPAEIADIKIDEAFSLLMTQTSYVSKIVEALKK